MKTDENRKRNTQIDCCATNDWFQLSIMLLVATTSGTIQYTI